VTFRASPDKALACSCATAGGVATLWCCLTQIDLGDAETLRLVQNIESQDEPTLLLELLSTGAHDPVYMRSLGAAAKLMRAL